MRHDLTKTSRLNMEMQVGEYIAILENHGFEVKNVKIYNKNNIKIIADVRKGSDSFECRWNADYTQGVLCFCKKCGNESWAEWGEIVEFSWYETDKGKKAKYEQDIRNISVAMKNCINKYKGMSIERKKNPGLEIRRCPFCDADFFHEKECYHMHYIGKIKSKFGKMQAISKENDNKEVQRKMDELLSLNSDSYKYENGMCKIDSIKYSSKELIEYIEKLINVEMNICFLKERLPLLYAQRMNINRKVTSEKYAGLYELKCELEKAEAFYNECINRSKQCKNANVPFNPPVRPSEPVYETPGLFNKKKVLESNELLKKRYSDALIEYNKQLEKYEDDRVKYIQNLKNEAEKRVEDAKDLVDKIKENVNLFDVKTEMISPSLELKVSIDEEIESAESYLKQFVDIREKMYAYNIIFSKYRNIVALTTFYEYLMAGRCACLDGANGAYNLYESEIRMNLIISQLSEVINKLDQIQQTQYMIYSQLTSMNSKLGALNSKMDSALSSIQNIEYNSNQMVRTNEMIAYNTAVTAHYSKMTAEYTNALGYLIALK